jgi:hypothetical protein
VNEVKLITIAPWPDTLWIALSFDVSALNGPNDVRFAFAQAVAELHTSPIYQ